MSLTISDGFITQKATEYPYIGTLPLVDVIATLQDNGYLVYEATEMPEITVNGGGRPKLPERWGEVREGVDERTARYEAAFGLLALARWWEAEAERRVKRAAALTEDLRSAGFVAWYSDAPEKMIAAGWRK